MTSRRRLFILNDPGAMRISAELAAEIGLMKSIVLLQFEFLLSITQVEREGKRWIRATLEELRQKYFKWSSRATIWRAIEDLQDDKLVIAKNFNTAGFDKTLWFTLNMRQVEKLKSVRLFQDETGAVFQNETLQVRGGEEHAGNSTSFQNETAGRDSRQDVSDRDVEVLNPEHRRDQTETAIVKELPAGDLHSSPKDADRDTGRQTYEILQLTLKAGKSYPKRWRGHLGREIKNLLDEGFRYHVVLEAAKKLETKSLNPSTMASLVNEVQNGNGGRGAGNYRPFDPETQDYESTVIG